MAHRLGRVSPRLPGACRATVPLLQLVHTLLGQPAPKECLEQVVVAVPSPLLIEANGEQVSLHKDSADLARVGAPGRRFGQIWREALEDGRVEQEPLKRLGL